MTPATRIFDILTNYEAHYSKPVMVAGKAEGIWTNYPTETFISLVDNLSKGLLAKGIQKGDKIALMSANRPEWNFCDFAINQLGAAIVPLYPTLSGQDLSFIIDDAAVKLIFVSTTELHEKITEALQANNLDVPIYSFDPVDGVPSWQQLVDEGATQDTDLTPYRDAVHADDLLTLIYTSGTTGKPKGVHLSHKNVITNVYDCYHLLPDYFRKALSFLPLCHIFERMVVYLYFAKGVEIHYAESLDTIVADINDVKPDGFTTVPRVLEKVYDRIVAKGKELSGVKRHIFFWALNLGLNNKEPEKNGAWFNMRLAVARKLVFSKWQAALGGNIKLIVSGGAALQPRLSRVFWAAGIPVLEGYGLTETSPVIAVNSLEKGGVKFGTVGKVLKHVDVKIAADGEILCKGPSISAGYYKNEVATSEAIDSEGYFHTGDIGELDAEGFLRITDRKKEMFKTAGGKYVAPQALENKYMESTLIAQVMVVGENRKFPGALIVPAFDVLENWCKIKGISFDSREKVIQKPEVIDKYQREINRLNQGFGHWEQVKKFTLLATDWTIDAGELTPKLSLKRKVILQRYEKEIEDIYRE
ncbi:AMP-dependent synthetase/ligase [Parapedobacter indicus]|uniref:Long-chain acyl-CoA synthetase n=1 Tax=Parapedobacter indicus TaxID=1477437 RepID=A0A1I3CRP3_9SPHI|nr:long-chain fatty acid--CoA ligase [Parapedobacter indicus]PPL04361.1 long-chain acyl-CoA synthetase [Parapedobacter indicus]SFH76941.1 long-chain acyl-CoA synthetase [Parapedobacter indicus]